MGNQRQYLSPLGGVVSHRPRAQTAGSQRQAQLQIKPVVAVHDILNIPLGRQSDLQLAGRADNRRQCGSTEAKVFAFRDNGGIPLLLQVPQSRLQLRKCDRSAVRVCHKMLHLQPEGELALRLAVGLKIPLHCPDLFVQLRHSKMVLPIIGDVYSDIIRQNPGRCNRPGVLFYSGAALLAAAPQCGDRAVLPYRLLTAGKP